MIRTLFVALLASTAITSAAQAQYAGRPMPSYDDGSQPAPGGYYDSYSSTDARRDADDRNAPDGYDEARSADAGTSRWVTPAPYARADQVDEGSPNDAAHRADRAYTAQLNRNASTRAPHASGSSAYARQQAQYQAQLAEHAREMQDYRYARERYAARIADWRARADACEGGNLDACEGPR